MSTQSLKTNSIQMTTQVLQVFSHQGLDLGMGDTNVQFS